jgi:hypothetical protein
MLGALARIAERFYTTGRKTKKGAAALRSCGKKTPKWSVQIGCLPQVGAYSSGEKKSGGINLG